MLILMDFLNGEKKNETKSAFEKIKQKNWIFFQNVHFQTNSLVGNISKLFRKLTSQV